MRPEATDEFLAEARRAFDRGHALEQASAGAVFESNQRCLAAVVRNISPRDLSPGETFTMICGPFNREDKL